MLRKPSFWIVVSLLCLAGAVYFWRQGEGRRQIPQREKQAAAGQTAVRVKPGVQFKAQSAASVAPVKPIASTAAKKSRYPYRLTNTDKTATQLLRSDKAIHLMNALIDTSKSTALAIPDRLRAPKDNGSYVVQARGPVDNNFRTLLQNAGATIVSYIPNNAYLVRVSDAGAQQLQSQVQSVLPFEPYYKLEPSLLKAVIENGGLPMTALKVTLFPDTSESVFDSLNIHPIATDHSPFGEVVTVPASPNTIVNIARLPGVQAVAPAYSRKAANDLDRPRLGVSVDSLAITPPYLGLSGSNVLVNINDSGVDMNHPDLTGRVFGDVPASLIDDNGHGTHVAGTILGNGSKSSTVTTNASGSIIPGAGFQGIATNADAFAINIDFVSDSYLQEQPALTNALISNNSWNYGDSDYDIEAASYDAAVRDALPEVTGPQPLIFVFSAGNGGGGNDDGTGGNPGTILSPATAKNVITVGAIEQPRNITNLVVKGGQTNQAFLPSTDSDDEVASLSSRGNVGIGIEGDNGRFKPDLVTPGTFVISTRSTTWDTQAYYNPTNFHFNTYQNQSVDTNSLTPFSIFIPNNAVGLTIQVFTNQFSQTPFPPMPIYVRFDDNPTLTDFDLLGTNQVSSPQDFPLVPGSTVFFSVGNSTNETIDFDVETILVTTNDNGNYFQVLSNLNESLNSTPPQFYYRYESGTSMSAAGVSGMLACMEEFFIQRLQISNASPALMKALLINGARSVAQQYDLQVSSFINYQGWGLPNLSNSIPAILTNSASKGDGATGPMQFFDQDTNNALATGQSKTYTVMLTTNSLSQPLRVTLVWTDPPGNPTAGTKLVNDLDLIVTNLDTGDVFFGNDIPSGSDFSESWNTNGLPIVDSVNNVENVFLAPSLGTNFSVTVFAHRVNVNAVTLNTNNVVQDYALVISSGDAGLITNAFTVATNTPINFALTGALNVLSNGIPLLNQRVGANSQYATTNGVTNQWNFYVYTNTTSFPNVAFVTFEPPNLGVTRMGTREEENPTNATRLEADIDLYVSSNPAITNLDPVVIAGADKSVTRTGTEKVLYTNSTLGQVYYIAVKSEDQEGAQYGFVGVATQLPFGQTDANGNIILTVLTSLPAPIPDGSPSLPGALTILALTTEESPARRVLVTDNVSHQNFGDLIGTLNHGQKNAVLNNHSFFDNGGTNETFMYDDSGENDIPGSRTTDFPGSLRNFVGDKASDGVWIFTMVDDALTQTGQVNSLNITVEPQPPTNGVPRTLVGGGEFFDFIDVPVNCTNLTVALQINGAAPLQLAIKRGAFPTLTDFDKSAIINPPGGSISISTFDSPPLNPGRYFIGVFNPNPTAVTFTLSESLGLSLTPAAPFQFLSIGNEPIADDAVTYSTNPVGINSPVVTAEVGVRIDHPRLSDLVLTLISPEGTRVLLAENRGGSSTNYGSGVNVTNVLPTTSAGAASASTNPIPLPNGQSLGTLVINYQFFTEPDDMRVYYAGVRIFDSGLISGSGTFAVDFGPGSATNVVIVMNEDGNPNSSTQWNYSATVITKASTYAIFTEDTNKTTLPIKFAVPPFGAGSAFVPASNVMTSDFEGFAAGDYNSVDGWTTLDTNTVKVVTVPALASTGTNILALHHGNISRILPTVTGTSYTLNFASHGRPLTGAVSWWKGENNGLDSADGNVAADNGSPPTTYTNGVVGQAFYFADGGGARMTAPDQTNLVLTNAVTVEAWVNPTDVPFQSATILQRGDARGGLDPYDLGVAFPTGNTCTLIWAIENTNSVQLEADGLPLNSFSHVAGTYDQLAGTISLYINGLLVAQTNTTVVPLGTLIGPQPGIGIGNDADNSNDFPFWGAIDEIAIYGTALTPLQLQDIYAAGSAGKILSPPDSLAVSNTMVLGTLITNVPAVDVWTTNSITFIATSDNMVLQFSAQDGLLLDSFSLVQNATANATNYYLPEESLAKLTGENALGDWKLEILDNRAGPSATNPAPDLVSWELTLVTERQVPSAIALTHAIAQSNTVAPNSIAFYYVDVPIWAQFATNTLFNVNGGSLNLLFNQNFEPGGTNGGDVSLLNNVTVANTVTLATNGVPPLVPGQRYYLGVQNLGATPVNFSIEVDFDITSLTNMVPLTNLLAASGIPRYYQYDVSSNSIGVSFQLFNLSGNVDLVARKGVPLPTLFFNDYTSARPGTSNEDIIVLTNSTPVPLSPGRWYLAVYNDDFVPVNYTIEAIEFGTPNIIPLTNDVPFTNSAGPGPALTNFYSFTITNTNSAVLFELYDLSGDVDLTLNRGTNNLPFLPPFFSGSFNPGTNREQIVVRTNIIGTNINDIWYLGVPNNDPTNVNYTIRAFVATNGILLSGVPISVGITNSTNGLTFTWPTVQGETYEIDQTTNFIGSNWTLVTIVSNAPPNLDTFVYSNSVPPALFTFFRILQIATP